MAKKMYDYESNAMVDAPVEHDPAMLEIVAKELSAFLLAVGIENEISPEELTSPEGAAALEAVRDMVEEAKGAIDLPDGLEFDPTEIDTRTAGALRMLARNKPLIRYLKEGGGEMEAKTPPVSEAREKSPPAKPEMTDAEIEQLFTSRMGGA